MSHLSTTSQNSEYEFDIEDDEEMILQLSPINSWLWVSGFEASEDVPRLAQLSINRVFNITPEIKSAHVLASYASAGITEQCFAIHDTQSANVISIIHEIAPSIQASDRILVHCQAGISRSVSVAIGLMMTLDGLSFESALHRIQDVRHIAQPNPSFLQQLQMLQHRYKSELDVSQYQ